jgi:hypothetical protein
MSVGANGIFWILWRVMKLEIMEARRECIHDLILQAQFQKNLLLFVLSRLNYTE